jgi:hypothetical protein
LGSPEPVSAAVVVILSVLDMPVSFTNASLTAGGNFGTKRSSEPKLS